MSNNVEIQSRLHDLEIPCTGAIVRGDLGEKHFFVHVPILRSAENKQIPPNKKLNFAKELFAKEGISIDFLLHDDFGLDVEGGLRATILHTFGDSVRNIFLSISEGVASVWIDPKVALEPEKLAEIKNRAEQFLFTFDIENVGVAVTTGEKLPSILVCLRTIRTLAPIMNHALLTELVNGGFSIPSLDWLNRRLDVMRKDGKIIRKEDGTYVLSLISLEKLGSERGRGSPDIKRILALGRGAMIR
ncbi:hypothetical protein [Undibacterium parvum]|uniref:Uncharacterized protein n=2 Tax=Undibacterium TaxID=401469 RepID=A0A6M3ZZM8_9BURK|nr:hypothetical protein [Undibacterium parvum]AZP13562.1 hypothetical protein EJN92_17145 [Undibacterium parvum]QJQ04562.1 hypothetical protein EJG51_000415 [Undibacterium piscinae]